MVDHAALNESEIHLTDADEISESHAGILVHMDNHLRVHITLGIWKKAGDMKEPKKSMMDSCESCFATLNFVYVELSHFDYLS